VSETLGRHGGLQVHQEAGRGRAGRHAPGSPSPATTVAPGWPVACGRGSFWSDPWRACRSHRARARQARRTTDGQMFVIKQVLCGNIKQANDALKEAKVLQRLTHSPHTGIVKYEDVFLHEVLRASPFLSACCCGKP
jgi:hypothetical protein